MRDGRPTHDTMRGMRAPLATALLLALLLPACDTGTATPAAPDAATSTTFPPRPAVQRCRFDGHAPGALPAVVGLPAFADLRFDRPVQGFPGPDGRLAIVERTGRILVVAADASAPDDAEVAADLRASIACCDDDTPGLLSAAVHPPTGRLYALYATAPGLGHVAEVGPGGVIRRLLEVPFDGGGHLLLGPDERLYLTLGDRAGVGRASPDALTGAVLRVGLDGGHAVWARGLRDPWRCAFGPSNALWCGDAGPDDLDEIDVLLEGSDHGWPAMLGRACRTEPCEPERYAGPLHRFTRPGPACGVVGGVHYRGQRFPALDGAYLFADRCDGAVRALRTTRVGVSEVATIGRLDHSVVHLGEDGAGDLYAVDEMGGHITRLEVPEPEPGFPVHLSESGCFEDLPSLAAAPGVLRYDVNAPLWTDGVIKDRHLVVPPDAAIERGDDGEWRFPTGSILLKTFSTAERPIETRVMVRREVDWGFHTYRWNDGGTDAELLHDRLTVDVALETADGPLHVPYLFPDRAGCGVCHGGSGRVLGPGDPQLDRTGQLEAMGDIGLFTEAGRGPAGPSMPDISDPAMPLEARARGYLHANCAHCHRPGGWQPPGLGLDLRAGIPLAEAGLCGVPLRYASLWAGGAWRIAPGVPSESNLLQRMRLRGSGQMPPIGTARADAAGLALVEAWIEALETCPDP